MVTTISLHVFVLHQPLSIRSYNSSTEMCCLPRKQHIWPTNASLKLHHNLPQSRKNQQTHRIKKITPMTSHFLRISKSATLSFFLQLGVELLMGGQRVGRLYFVCIPLGFVCYPRIRCSTIVGRHLTWDLTDETMIYDPAKCH